MRSFLFLLVLLVSACIAPAQRFVKTVNSWADLLSLNPNDVHTNAFVVYGTTVGDEQGGIFTYFSNSSEDTNLQTVLKPYSYNGRWIKQAGNFLTNTYVTNLYASNIYTTNLTVVNLISNYVTTNITLETLYVTNLYATNAVYYTTNVTIRGERVRINRFDTNQFEVTVASNPVLSDVAIKNGANVTNLVSQNRLVARAVFAMGSAAFAQIANAATNSVATASSSWIDMDSDSAVPGARVLSLDAGAANGQMLVIRNIGGANTFTLPNSSAVTGGGQVNLSGTDWQAKPGEAILLIYDESFQDWNEIGRFGSGTTAGLVANLTPGYIPYATSTNTLGDSPLYRLGTQSLGMGTFAATRAFLVNRVTTIQIGELAGTNTTPSFSTLVGANAGRDATTIAQSALFGHNVAISATNIYRAVGIGPEAFNESAYRSNDVAIGYQSGSAIGLSWSNVVAGSAKSGLRFTNPIANVFLGAGIGGIGNETNAIVIGAHAVGGGPNVAVIGNTNVASLYLGKVGKVDSDGNVAFGLDALKATTTNANVAIGKNALYQSTIAKWNVAIGEDALSSVTTSDVRGNIAIGTGALDTKTSGQWDIAIGHGALGQLVTGGGGYTVIGTEAGASATSSGASTLIGYTAGNAITSGSGNTIVGKAAGLTQTTASNNDLYGENSAYLNLTGGNNTVIGKDAFYYVTNISKTVVLGQQKQGGTSDIMTNNIVNSVFIGYKDTSITNNVPGLTNVVSIGYNTIATNNNQMVLGNASNTELLLGANRGIYWGSGAPAIIANRGSLYLRTDGGAGTTLYVKEADDGAATGWAAK